MFRYAIIFIVLLICIDGLGAENASAQGGWRQWQIHLTDGTVVEANPLQLRADGKFTRSMNPKEAGFGRTKIDYLAAVKDQLPPTPTGKFRQDLIVFLDGKRSLGKVTIKSLRFSEGVIVQNGKELSLENVAYVKFARPGPAIMRRKN